MRVAIIHGSPKGEYSVTLQYVKYLQKRHPGREYDIIHVGRDIGKIEKDRELLLSILAKIREADAVLWSTPVFYFAVPSQLMRFIDLVSSHAERDAFEGKYATSLTTSVHFFDHTAHRYLQSVSEDLGMRYVTGYSAHMEDLMKADQRESLFRFGEHFFRVVEGRRETVRGLPPLGGEVPEYVPGEIEEVPKGLNKSVVVLTDAGPEDMNLTRMVDTLVKLLPCKAEVVNINELALRGGCLSCYQCAYDNVCVYNDDMQKIFREKITPADAIIQAIAVRGRFLSVQWKIFMDRSFFNGHVPIYAGKAIGFLVAGPLRQAPALRQVLEGESDVSGAYPLGIVTDEDGDSQRLTGVLRAMALETAWALDKNVSRPPMFFGAASQLLFRDMVYSMRFFFQADHRWYVRHQMYNFPQKNVEREIMNFCMSALTTIPSFRRGFYRNAKERMLERYEKVIREG
jgi:multimeric flavodoxin WrbA